MSRINDSFTHMPLLAFALGAFILCLIMLSASSLLGGKAWGRSKNKPFESGMMPVGSARLRFSAKFYLVAILFVIFEVEALFLIAWAVSVRETGWVGFICTAIFISILVVGLIYETSVKALEWSPSAYKSKKVESGK